MSKDLRPTYAAPAEPAAAARFEEFAEHWGARYPAVVRLWRSAWSEFVPCLDYDVALRRVICTTNACDSMISICRIHSVNVKHWRDGRMALC